MGPDEVDSQHYPSACIDADVEILPATGQRAIVYLPPKEYAALARLSQQTQVVFRLTFPRVAAAPGVPWLRPRESAMEAPCEQYALPVQVVEALRGRLLDENEYRDELSLARECAESGAIGKARDYIIAAGPYAGKLRTTDLPREFVQQFDWASNYERFIASIEGASPVLDENRDRMLAYTGFLLTNRQFQRELALVRQFRRRIARATAPEVLLPSFAVGAVADDGALESFLIRWRLCSMLSWRVPCVQGPNLTPLPMPRTAIGTTVLAMNAIPSTVSPTSRSKTAASIPENSDVPHLADWHATLNKRSRNGLGPKQYASIAKLYVWYKLAVLPRYRGRLRGVMPTLDAAFGGVLRQDPETVKRLRLNMGMLLHRALSRV